MDRSEISELMAMRQTRIAASLPGTFPDEWIFWLADQGNSRLFAFYKAGIVTRDEVRAALLLSLQWERKPDAALGYVRSGWLTAEEVRSELRNRAKAGR